MNEKSNQINIEGKLVSILENPLKNGPELRLLIKNSETHNVGFPSSLDFDTSKTKVVNCNVRYRKDMVSGDCHYQLEILDGPISGRVYHERVPLNPAPKF